jgi:hypothetical protein
MSVLLALLLVASTLCLVAYRVMIAVKPDVPRPASGGEMEAVASDLAPRLRRHVELLAATIGERHLGRPEALRQAEAYIRRTWEAQGFSVREELFAVQEQRCANLLVEIQGVREPERIVLVGAHYDTAPGTPGANDNGSGVALLLEMSRALRDARPHRTIRFVAFTNEEPPHFFSERMGSRVHAREAKRRGERVAAMLSLETIGYYADAPGSQGYPPPFSLFYPRRGNFLAVVGDLASRGLVVDFLRHFMAAGDFPVEGVATAGWIPGINWSDHWSFWKEGYPAVMLTDTAPFRYPEYHRAGDRPDRMTWPAFARASAGIIAAVRGLAGAP